MCILVPYIHHLINSLYINLLNDECIIKKIKFIKTCVKKYKNYIPLLKKIYNYIIIII